MPKKQFFLFALVITAACFLSYKIGSAPTALAKARVAPQDTTGTIPPPLPTAPATWVVTDYAGSATAGSITRAAGGTGAKHVATCILAALTNSGTATEFDNLNLLDGSRSGTVLTTWHFSALPGTTVQVNICDLNIVGSANNSMTLGFAAGVTQGAEQVNLVGYDAM